MAHVQAPPLEARSTLPLACPDLMSPLLAASCLRAYAVVFYNAINVLYQVLDETLCTSQVGSSPLRLPMLAPPRYAPWLRHAQSARHGKLARHLDACQPTSASASDTLDPFLFAPAALPRHVGGTAVRVSLGGRRKGQDAAQAVGARLHQLPVRLGGRPGGALGFSLARRVGSRLLARVLLVNPASIHHTCPPDSMPPTTIFFALGNPPYAAGQPGNLPAALRRLVPAHLCRHGEPRRVCLAGC